MTIEILETKKPVKDARKRLKVLEDGLEKAKKELESERELLAVAMVDGGDLNVNGKVTGLSERVRTLKAAVRLAGDRVENVIEVERVKLAKAGQKKITVIFKRADKELENMRSHLEAVESSYKSAKELQREAFKISKETGGRAFGLGQVDISVVLFKVKQILNAVTVKE